KCLGGTRKLSNSSIVHTWSVSPAAMAGVTGFHFFREPLASPIHRRNNRTCYILSPILRGSQETSGEREGRKSTTQETVLKFHNHSADTRDNDTFSEKVSVCLVDAKPPSRSTSRLPNARHFSRGSGRRLSLLALPDVAG